MKNEWKYMRGLLRILIKARKQETEKYTVIQIEIDVDHELNNNDFIDYLNDLIRALSNLKGANNPDYRYL